MHYKLTIEIDSNAFNTVVSPSKLESSVEHFVRFLGIGLTFLVPYLSILYLFPGAAPLRSFATYAVLVAAVAGIAGTIYWNAFAARIDARMPLRYIPETVIRYFLAFIFVTYGFAKFFRTQLYEPFLYWQDMPTGELSGFQLTWTFFGSSYAYCIFIGGTQVMCAGLLLFRRTQLLGSCILLPVITNIVFVNFAYDIPVKFASRVFLTMTLYLVMTDFWRLKALYWDNDHVPRRQEVSIGCSRKLMLSFKWSFIFLLLVGTIWSFEAITSHNPYIERSVFGIWDVTRFESDGQTLYSREDLGDTWTKLIFEAQFGGKRAVLLTQDQRTMATYDINEDSGHLELYGRGMSFIGQYELQTDHSMVLTGRRGDDSVHVELTRR